MSLWLPHGLAPSVQISDLARQISLCKYQDAYKVGAPHWWPSQPASQPREAAPAPLKQQPPPSLGEARLRRSPRGRHQSLRTHPCARAPLALAPTNHALALASPPILPQWSSPCHDVKFTLDRVDRGKLLMRVPSFGVRDHYRIAVKGTSNVSARAGHVRPHARAGQAPHARCA